MVVSLANIPKGSLVYHFITSGHRGRCNFCSKMVDKLEAHHVTYDPEKTINLCHHCHHKVHYWPNRLSESEKTKLLLKRFSPGKTQEIMNDKSFSFNTFRQLVAPSRSEFRKKLEISHRNPKR